MVEQNKITDEEFINKCHILIHSLRLIPNYNPTNAEKVLSNLVLDKFADSCSECKLRKETLSNTKQPDKSFLQKLKEAI